MKTPMKIIYRTLTIIMLTVLPFIKVIGEPVIQNNPDGKRQYRQSDTFSDFDIQVKGDISVTDDDSGIKSISPGGYLKISKSTFGNKRSVIVESNSKGDLNFQYYEGRSEKPFDPEGRKWLSDVMLDVIRITGIDAENRTKRIYANKGVQGVLDEIHEIPSNSVMALYFGALLKNFNLNETELNFVCAAIPQEMSSNTESAQLFREFTDLFLKTNSTAIVFFRSVSKLSSNTERGNVLTNIHTKIDFNDPQVTESYFGGIDKMSSNTETGEVLRYTARNQNLPDQAVVRLLMSVMKMSSNTEMGAVLTSLDKLNMGNSDVSAAYFSTIDKMSSNTEAGNTLRQLITDYDLDDDNYIRLLRSVKKLSSNTEMGSVMRSIKKINLANPEVNEAYFLAINSMSSNTEAGSVLRYTIKYNDLNTDSWLSLFNSVSKLSSKTEMGSVMSVAVYYMPFEKPVLNKFFDAASHFSSSTEQGRVLSDVIESSNLNKYAVIGVLNNAKKMVSNTEKSNVMIKVAGTSFITDPDVKSAYTELAGTLTSDSEYRRVMDKIVK